MLLRTAAVTLATLTLAGIAGAQVPNPVHWTATPEAKTVKRGGEAAVKLVATIDEGWHIYSITQGPGGPIPTRISVPTNQPFSLAGAVQQSAPDKKFDPNFGIQVESYENTAEFTVPLKVAKSAKPGKRKVQIATRYEVCNASVCLPPHTVKVDADLTVKGGK